MSLVGKIWKTAVSIKRKLVLINVMAALLSVCAVFAYPKGDRRPVIIMMIGIICSVLLIFNVIEKEKESEKEKEKLLRSRYPKVVYALTAYTEGGMSAREALRKMTRQEIIGDGILFDELSLLNYELDNGLGMEKALLMFASRIKVNEYKKLAGLLAQNERKGSVKLSEVLSMELLEASNNKMRMIKEQSEARKVKMLLPITMLLLVVILILMGPAFIQLKSM